MTSDVMPSIVQMEYGVLKTLLEEVKETLATDIKMPEPAKPSFGAGTVAVEVGNQIWVGSFTGDRIAIFPSNR